MYCLLDDLLSLKTDVNVPSISTGGNKKNIEKFFVVEVMKSTKEKSKIRIRTKTSRIRNTGTGTVR